MKIFYFETNGAFIFLTRPSKTLCHTLHWCAPSPPILFARFILLLASHYAFVLTRSSTDKDEFILHQTYILIGKLKVSRVKNNHKINNVSFSSPVKSVNNSIQEFCLHIWIKTIPLLINIFMHIMRDIRLLYKSNLTYCRKNKEQNMKIRKRKKGIL